MAAAAKSGWVGLGIEAVAAVGLVELLRAAVEQGCLGNHQNLD